MSNSKKKTAFVFSHVHWDIEWYLPFHSFRFWLIRMIDRLIDSAARKKGFRCFVLDGQVAPIEHYLAVHPEREAAIRRLVRSGKLALGPFYTQFDEWLTGPEAIVRNALYGGRRARHFGRSMKAGYLPDNFGHPAQMPQILAGFGIDSLIFMRGMPEPPPDVKDQFRWIGLDGTASLALQMSGSYAAIHAVGARRAPYASATFRPAPYGDYTQTPDLLHAAARDTDFRKGVETLIEKARLIGEKCPTGVIPLPNGYDSAAPQETIAELISRANKAQSEFNFIHGDCEQLVKEVRGRAGPRAERLPEFRGEMWGGRFSLILTGTLATRSYLKQANFIAESLLEKYAEPLSAVAAREGKPWPIRQLEEAWRELFHNQAHDGIHGSSADPVHEAMVQRYNAARQIAVGLAHEALAHMAARACRPGTKKSFVLAYRPPAAGAADIVTDTWLHDFDPTRQHLTDAKGRRLLVQTVHNPWRPDAQRPRESGSHAWPDGNPTHVLIASGIPAGGITVWQVGDGPSPKGNTKRAKKKNTIENDFLRVSFKRGAFEILDKQSGKFFGGIGIIEDEADRGDAWDFSPPWEPSPVISSLDFPASCSRIENGPVRSALEAVVKMRVPRRLEGERRSRELVELTVTLRISIMLGARRADLSVEFDNNALDHRVRLRVPTGIVSDEVKSQGHFGILSRPIRHPDEDRTGMAQAAPSTFHFREWVAVDDSRRGLAVAAQGLHQYESRKGARGTDLFVTLLRGIGRMGRFGLVTRQGATSPATPTPGAQCPGPQRFELSFLPYGKTGPARSAPFIHEAESFLYPPIAHQADPNQRMINPAVHPARNGEIGLAPPFTLNQANLRFSAFKRSEDGKGWILRFWENEGRKTRARLALAPRFRRVFETDLEERERIPLEMSKHGVEMKVEPYRIVTLYMEEQK